MLENYKEILTVPNLDLECVCRELNMNDPSDQALARDTYHALVSALEQANAGIGLAAPQIGVPIRMFITESNINFCSRIEDWTSAPICYINPVILPDPAYGSEKVLSLEGCLSLPGEVYEVTRIKNILCKYTTLSGRQRSFTTDRLEAICLQHELDHLNGILISDAIRQWR